jgi:acetoin utilization protein AcuB
MQVRDAMSHVVITVTPQDNLKKALERIQWAGRHIPVVDNGQVIGIITDRDLRLALNSPLILHERLQDERLLAQTPVAACMTPNPFTIYASASLHEAAELMLEHKISGLPVIDEVSGELQGVITLTDLLRVFVQLTKTL